MNHTILTVIVFSFLVGTLVFAIWSNTHVFAQQLPSSVSSSSASPAAGNRSSSSSPSNTISSELKAKMCEPSNPGLKVVNTTESKICGIPKTIKPSLLSSAAATPPTSPAVSSSASPSQQQTTTTEPTTAAATNGATPPPKQQQQIATTNKNNTNASSRPINSTAGAAIAPVSNPNNKSLSSSTLPPAPSAIAPQVKAINQQQKRPITRINSTTTEAAINSTAPQVKAVNEQQQQLPAPSPITLVNGTNGQNYTYVASPPVVSSDKLLYLGYHDEGDTNPTNSNSNPKDKSSSDSKSAIDRSTSTTSDNDSTGKKTSSYKLDRADSTNDKSTSFDVKPSNPLPHIKITAPDNDASSKNSNKKTTSSAKLDRADNTSDDDAKSFIDLITGSVSDSGPVEKKASSYKLDRADSTNEDSSPKDKSSSDSKPSTPHIKITAPDNDSIEKEKKASSYKLDRADSTKDESSFKKDKSNSFDSKSYRHTNDGTDSLSSSDLASTFRNKVGSIILNSPGEGRHNLFGFSDHGF